jgi:hypothetical protein
MTSSFQPANGDSEFIKAVTFGLPEELKFLSLNKCTQPSLRRPNNKYCCEELSCLFTRLYKVYRYIS